MTQSHAPFRAILQDGGLVAGPMRWPRNLRQDREGSVYEDATARSLGLRGGTVDAPLHMEQFPPLLVHLFGDEWWRRGNLSLYFRYATTDQEGVQCFAVEPQSDASSDVTRSEVWIDHQDGHRVAEGTAAVGNPDLSSALRRRLQHVPEARDLRILEHMRAGREVGGLATRIETRALEERLRTIVEPVPAYEGQNAWRVPLLPPGLVLDSLIRASTALLAPGHNYGVGLYGAIEIQFYDGPMFPDTDYLSRSKVLAVSETPKTEYFWVETIASDAERGNDVVAMLMMMRWMKASHPFWKDLAENA